MALLATFLTTMDKVVLWGEGSGDVFGRLEG